MCIILFLAMPVIEQSPEDNAVEIGRIVQLSCFVSGVPQPNITFYHNDAEVVLDSRISQIGPFLLITNAIMADQGTYYCNTTNVVGTSISSSATLVVFGELHNQRDTTHNMYFFLYPL